MSSFPQGSVSPAQPPWPLTAPQMSKQSRWPTIVAILIALIAVALAVVGWFRPVAKEAANPQPTYTDQQVADAKAKVCAAYAKAHQAVIVGSQRAIPDDPTSKIAFATAGRQALDVGSRYIALILAEEPATSDDLREAATDVTTAYQKLAINYLAEVSQSELDSTIHASDDASIRIDGLCK